MIFLSLLPILFLAVVIIIIYGASKKVNLMNRRRGQWMVIGYMAILLIGIVVYAFIPKDTIPSEKDWSAHPNLYLTALEGDIKDLDSEYLVKQWDLPLNSKELTIAWDIYSHVNPTVFIEKKDINQPEVRYYRTPAIINEKWDISEHFPIVEVDFQDSKITLQQPEFVHVELHGYKKEFPITQFTGEGSGLVGSFHGSSQIVYIQVPNDVEINYDSNNNFHLVK